MTTYTIPVFFGFFCSSTFIVPCGAWVYRRGFTDFQSRGVQVQSIVKDKHSYSSCRTACSKLYVLEFQSMNGKTVTIDHFSPVSHGVLQKIITANDQPVSFELTYDPDNLIRAMITDDLNHMIQMYSGIRLIGQLGFAAAIMVLAIILSVVMKPISTIILWSIMVVNSFVDNASMLYYYPPNAVGVQPLGGSIEDATGAETTQAGLETAITVGS